MMTQWKKFAATLSAAALLSLSSQTVLAQNHDHSKYAEGHAQLSLNNGQKWVTDDNLRLGMSRIRDAVAAELPAIHSGKATVKQYSALAKKTDEQVAFMVQNCRLEPKADAMLHLLLADVIAGADAMRQQDLKQAGTGAERLVHALEEYATYFEHPGWHALKPLH